VVEELFGSFIDEFVVCTPPSSQPFPILPRRGPSDGYAVFVNQNWPPERVLVVIELKVVRLLEPGGRKVAERNPSGERQNWFQNPRGRIEFQVGDVDCQTSNDRLSQERGGIRKDALIPVSAIGERVGEERKSRMNGRPSGKIGAREFILLTGQINKRHLNGKTDLNTLRLLAQIIHLSTLRNFRL
jgi:hypothetical protein